MATCSSYTEIFCWIAVLSLAASASTQTARYQSTRESEPKEASVRNLPGKSRPGAAIDPTKGQLIHENPTLIREIEAQLHDQDDDLLQDQEQKRRSPELDNIIQQVFSPQEYQEYTNENSDGNIYLQDQLPTKFPGTDQSSSKASSQRSSPYKVIIIKGGVRPPRRNVLKRKLLLRRLKSPIFRSSQSDSDTNNEQGSEELLHNILESIDREDSDDGNSIRNAFLTKTTTYNISKLVESSKNRSFLIEKLVNYSTNLNLLHSDNVPSNYSDAHSSVLQTVLHLGQHDQNTNISPNNEENWKSDGSDSNDNSLSNDIVASPIRSGVNNEDNNIFKESPEESKSEFLGGQFVRMANESPSKVPKINANKINKQVIPDFVGGTYVGVDDGGESNNLDSNDLKPTPIEFVGGTYVQQQPNSEENVPSRTVKPTIENHELLPPISILGVAPSASQTENYYETTTFSDEGIDRTYKKEFRLEKKYQIPNRKPVFGGNNEVKPAKAKGSVPIVMQLADTPGNILKSKYSGEITTNSDIFTISDDSSIISDNKIKSFGLNKNRNGPSSYTDMPSSFKEEKESILSGVSQKNYNDYGSEEENVETETDSATTESDLSSLENEEYTDRSYAYLGLKPTDSSYGILKTDLTTGNLITERTNDILSKSLTGANSLEEIETESPTRSNIQRYVLPTQPSRGFDLVVGQASDIEPSKLRSQGNTEKPNDLFTSDEQLSEENNITGLVDEVELYAGTGTMESEYQTTPTYILENNNDGSYTFKINNSDSSEENTTELCLPLNKKNYPSLFDLLSGKLYLEKDGRKIKLQLKDNPMKSCNSGTKTCKLFLNLKNSDDPSILDEMFEVSDDNAISKDFDSKSKNGKRSTANN